jgi:hypothetical protein
MNVLKALASIISMCSIHVILLSKITPRYLMSDNKFCGKLNTYFAESELFYDWRFTANQFALTTCPLRLMISIFFQLITSGNSPYVTSSLTRGWACRLQMLLVLTSEVILRSGSRGTHDHISLSQIRDSHNLDGQVPVYISPGTGWLSCTPRQWVPFSLPPTTQRLWWR